MNFFKWLKPDSQIAKSILYDENTFYNKFIQDLLQAKKEVIIESPFITAKRMALFFPIFQKLIQRGVKIHILTKDPAEYEDEHFKYQAANEILACADVGITVTFIENHHRKIAVIDRFVLWEGSLNILSQSCSLEIMRRIESKYMTEELCKFLKFDKLML